MNLGELINIKTTEEAEFMGLEEKHTPYRAEIMLFSCVQQGDAAKLMNELKKLDLSVITGKMSDNSVMQYRYTAVSAITLATRYAIQGGVNEKTAYEFSDRVIMLIDNLETKSDIMLCLANEILKLTQMVSKSKKFPSHSPYVRKCIAYINENICRKISISDLSRHCGISSDYLSRIFKEEIGEALSSYITRKKLEIAKAMLLKGASNEEICKKLSFSSKSYFITVFKKYFHMTPGEYTKL